MMVSLKVLKTSSFRLAAIYLTVFAISIGAVLSYVYWNTVVLLQEQTDDTIGAEVQGLAEQYRQRGLSGLIEVIKSRSKENNGSVYLFTNFVGRRMAGNLNSLPVGAVGDEGWFEFPYGVRTLSGREQHVARAYHLELAGGFTLVVGRDVEERLRLAELIRTALYWALGLAAVFGVSGSLLLSRNFLARIDSISATSRTIMAGDLTGRMPVSGTGDELDRLALSLNDMLDQIERLMSGMKEVSSNVAHDLRTPLTRMRSRVEAALRSDTPKDQRAALESTLSETDQLLATFNALLSIAKAESGQARAGFIEVDVVELIAEMADLYEPIIEDLSGTLSVHTDPGTKLRADRQLLAQMLTNLIDNVLKYGLDPKTGEPHVELFAGQTADEVTIYVADKGPGIEESDRPRVTERFVRLEKSRSASGNGLGLSLVKGVMKLHNGTLDLQDNNPGLKVLMRFKKTLS
ncbi:Sensor protein basS/pmrB [hydrothermal vent metagenome]|uniref:histidine kinase n=1 Tax=hydrothermal vent metagenome TaxID=652676 RepID=A0A3B0SAW8_9ZZZZ